MTESLILAPILPPLLIWGFAVLGLVLVLMAAIRGAGGWLLRGLVLAVLVLAAANPQAVREEHDEQRDVALIAVDRSPSQRIGTRTAETEAAIKSVTEALSRFEGLDAHVIEVTGESARESSSDNGDGGTQMYEAVSQAAAEIPRRRFAGTILITDGQIHDLPQEKKEAAAKSAWPGPVPGPVHVLLTGKPGESDRRLVIEEAPGYGIVGKEVTIRYRIEDRAAKNARSFGANLARVRFRYDDNEDTFAEVPIGKSDSFTFFLDHAGPTVVEMEVSARDGELSTVNNRTLININGVRDRLRVLLVSGQPHAGERTWRNLLKSDPSVDLVHFTILRPPEKDDFTPLKELALIAFPIQELFEEKLRDFDLIVLDRYVIRDVLPPSYLRNIGNFVKEGGALLLALGPEFASMRSLYRTPLGQIMPASPTGRVLERGFKPSLTPIGRRHPVTSGLQGVENETPEWGRWFRQIDAVANSGQILMRGADDKPLLLLERKGKGRIAQFLSDHIWLWARGFEGGGPQGELLRRLAHWLMKEPDLEEEGLRAEIRDGRLYIRRRSLSVETPDITVTTPDGKTKTLKLDEAGGKAVSDAKVPGLYKISDGTQSVRATMGALNPLEYRDLRASDEKLKALAKATGGGIHWISQGIPDIRRTRPGRDQAGRGWIGLTANRSFIVSGLAQVPVLPGWLVMVLVLAGLMAAWHREGK